MRYGRSYRVADVLFRHTLGRLRAYRTHSADIEVLGDSLALVRRMLAEERDRQGGIPRLLDIGARSGERRSVAEGWDYTAMDLVPPEGASGHGTHTGDICACPEIPDAHYDAVMSFDVLEHVARPWLAARECLRIVRPGGLIVHRSVFAYRYHPFPVDYWRFTAQGLAFLFEDAGAVQTLVSGYDLRARRRDARGHPRWREKSIDRPPIDFLGGFRENWRVLWIGRRLG